MFEDRISAKALIATFAGYFVISLVAVAVLVTVWRPHDLSTSQLRQLAETDSVLLIWQNVLGILLTTAAGGAACQLSGRKGLKNSTVFGAIIALFGVLGIYLHPDHPVWMLAGRLVLPIPLSMLGGWICLHWARTRLSH